MIKKQVVQNFSILDVKGLICMFKTFWLNRIDFEKKNKAYFIDKIINFQCRGLSSREIWRVLEIARFSSRGAFSLESIKFPYERKLFCLILFFEIARGKITFETM